MPAIEVSGLCPLKGEIKIQGSKNGVLPVMAAALLHKGTTVIDNVPRIQDVFCMLGILESLGCICSLEGHLLTIDAANLDAAEIPEKYVKSMRSSIFVTGPLVARLGRAVTSFPGGCSIGKRPIDLHLMALKALGTEITKKGDLHTFTAERLEGTDIHFGFPSVGATENAVMAAVMAEGVTTIYGAAKEPEIVELCRFLRGMGAAIHGAGSSILTVEGASELHDSYYRVSGDRIVAGTYIMAVMAAGGDILMRGADPTCLERVFDVAGRMGAKITVEETHRQGEITGRSLIGENRCEENWGIAVSMDRRPDGLSIMTGPYPNFPTDLQSPLMAVMAGASGVSRIEETIFEARFGTADELKKLGADIIIEESKAVVRGRRRLSGGRVRAGDLRGGAALVVAGLGADGVTVVEERGYIERGYEDICRDLGNLGARIRKLE